MSFVIDSPSLWQRAKASFSDFDLPLTLIVLFMCAMGLMTMYSAGYDHGTRFIDQCRNMALAAGVIFVMAQLPPQRLMAVAVPLYSLGLALLIATLLFGLRKKGATRWLNLGVVVQPSELMKIAMPLMLAWWFQRREGQLRALDFFVAGALLLVPVGLVALQPDLGTAILILSAGLFVIYFAGLSWRLIVPVVLVAALGVGLILWFEDQLCQPGVDWVVLHGYQKTRVCTLLDPHKDPLGKGFHILQGMVAIGAGGISGKGFMQGTQTHLEFIPERTTDFIFAAFGEEFGLVGGVFLMVGFLALIFRSLVIAAQAPTLFSRLLAGSIAMSFFTYAFVNMGMVMGMLPVVGVPLPFISYGGTAMVSLGLALGMLMSIAKSRGLMQR
jgi:rod shape determining protein RodA